MFIVQREIWMDFAVCQGAHPSQFVLDRGHTAAETVKNYCSKCPVTEPCRSYAERTNSVGIWGGVVFNFKSDSATEYYPLKPVEPIKVEPLRPEERKRSPNVLALKVISKIREAHEDAPQDAVGF